MKRALPVLLLSAILCFSGCGSDKAAQETAASGQLNYSEKTITAVQILTDGDMNGFYALFDENMRKNNSKPELQVIWNKLNEQYGDFQYYLSDVTISSNAGYHIADVPCVFANGTVTFHLTFNNAGEISSFDVIEGQEPSGSPRLRQDTEVSFGSHDYPLSGSLTLPDGSGPFPAVILVQDSGSYDRNEQIGPNIPFFDLADQLAQQGVAVLRYDNRTYSYDTASSQEGFTVQDEIIDDIIAAVDFLNSRNIIDPEQIYIAGHGFAGYLMPRIAEQTPDAAGYIMLAAAARPPEDLLLEQTQYVLQTEKNLKDDAKEQLLQQTETIVANIKQVTADSAFSEQELYNLPASYWLDLQNYDPLTQVQQVKRPMLFIQGGRDYQVSTVDFELWQSALQDEPDVLFHYNDNLNHLFMSGTGKSTPSEYQQKETVSSDVSSVITNFIKQRY